LKPRAAQLNPLQMLSLLQQRLGAVCCAEMMQRLQVGSQHHSAIHEQYRCWHESWQRIQSYSRYQTHVHQKQHYAIMLQLASQEFHLQYWNMQQTRHLVGSLQFGIGLHQIKFKVWSPQTSSDMPRSDPV